MMNDRMNQKPGAARETNSQPAVPVEAADELDLLSDAATQEAYRQEYLKQLRQRFCPGCGEDFKLF